MYKCWYILINFVKEGPYSYTDLKENPFITPDTLVLKEGWKKWLPIREVPELKDLFKEEELEEEESSSLPAPGEDAVLSLEFAEPPFFLWFLIALVVLTFVIYRLSQ
ncbi:Uncharacterized protein PHSC3_002036 [Chlamydiales bacterium STE3]|nr:Uncharacterized protein PHSC3_002036 [Chlamydiales bacterium STE3]